MQGNCRLSSTQTIHYFLLLSRLASARAPALACTQSPARRLRGSCSNFEAFLVANGFAGGLPFVRHEGQVQIWRFVQVSARRLASPAAYPGSGQSRSSRKGIWRGWRMRCGRNEKS